MDRKLLVTGGSGFIGTTLTAQLLEQGIDFVNVDIKPPKIEILKKYWVDCDILEVGKLNGVFEQFKPTAVVHLAAETDTDPAKTLEDYLVNTQGTSNVLNSVKACPSVLHMVLTSTQFVNQRSGGPKHDEDFAPYTIYGESKVLNEKEIRNANMPCCWTIVRPTNVWGPWHLRYPFEFWKVLAEGKYVHPGRQQVIRSYGYVGNVSQQIRRILDLRGEKVNGKVFYVGDRPIDLYDWVNGFSMGQLGRKVRVVPRVAVRLAALAGDLLRMVGIRFPITTSRYHSMTTNNPVNMDNTFSILGEPEYSLQSGIGETVAWMRKTHPELVKT